MRFLKRVQPQDVSDDWAVLALGGPSAPKVLEAAGLPVPGAGAALPIADAGFVRRVRPWTEASVPEFALVLPRARAAQVAAQLRSAGAEPVGTWAYAALRIDQLRPRLGLETDHRTIPHEVGWIDTAVHLNKGCCRGQETVARVHNLGKPPRRLVRVHLSGMTDVLPEPGAPVESGGRTVGFVGTAIEHHSWARSPWPWSSATCPLMHRYPSLASQLPSTRADIAATVLDSAAVRVRVHCLGHAVRKRTQMGIAALDGSRR